MPCAVSKPRLVLTYSVVSSRASSLYLSLSLRLPPPLPRSSRERTETPPGSPRKPRRPGGWSWGTTWLSSCAWRGGCSLPPPLPNASSDTRRYQSFWPSSCAWARSPASADAAPVGRRRHLPGDAEHRSPPDGSSGLKENRGVPGSPAVAAPSLVGGSSGFLSPRRMITAQAAETRGSAAGVPWSSIRPCRRAGFHGGREARRRERRAKGSACHCSMRRGPGPGDRCPPPGIAVGCPPRGTPGTRGARWCPGRRR